LPSYSIPTLWQFDATAKSSQITLTNDNYTAKKNEVTGHAAVCGNNPLGDGISSWEIKVNGITKGNGDWVQFGLLDKNENGDFEKFAFGNSWAVFSGNYHGNVIKMTKTGETVDFNNKTFVCTYDGQSGKFTVVGVDNKFKAECSGLQNKKLYAFVDLYDVGNEVTVKMIN